MNRTADLRYFVHQDRNWNVIVAMSEYDTAGTNNGRTVNRFSYTAYGPAIILAGDTGSGESAYVQPTLFEGYALPPTGPGGDFKQTGGGSVRLGSVVGIIPPFPPIPRGPIPRDPIPRKHPEPQDSQAVLCCHWFSSSNIPLGRHCQLRVISRSGGKCYATDYEGSNPLPPGIPWGGSGSPCVDPPPPPYEVPCSNPCASSDPDTEQIGDPVTVPPNAQQCLASASGCGKEYDPLGSNSNAMLGLMMHCCGIPSGPNGIGFPPDAPGWGGDYGGGGPPFQDPDKPCVDMWFPLFCTKCANCSDFGMPDNSQ